MKPELVTIPASLTVPKENFDIFVEKLGYQTHKEDESGKLVKNQETPIEFAQKEFKYRVVLPFITQFAHNDADVKINDEREESRNAVHKAIDEVYDAAVTVG